MYAICYASDDNYALQVGVSIKSLLKNNENIKTKIYIFEDNISLENKKKLLKIVENYFVDIIFIDTSLIIERIKKTGLVSNVDNSSLSTFVRLFVQDYIPIEYETLIYIDADTMIVDSIQELIDFNSNKPIAAVIDIMPEVYKKIIGFKDSYYFNCGVLLINMQLWRNKKCEERILHHITQEYNKYLYADQDVINIVLKDEIEILPLKFNVFPFYGEIQYDELISYIGSAKKYYTEIEYQQAKENPAIVHLVYSVVDRPWFKGNMNNYSERWEYYLSKTDWKICVKKKRKFYSRTNIMQLLYKLFDAKLVILIQNVRNKQIFNNAKKQYKEDGII